MGSKKKYIKQKVITLAQQANMIEILYPSFETQIKSYGELVITGVVKPTNMSRKYEIRITYVISKIQKVEIINPKLDDSTCKLPHVYNNNELCLFYPKYKEWTKYDYIAEKIIPWTTLWLYYYEVWRITGVWHGGGKHLNSSKKIKKENRYNI